MTFMGFYSFLKQVPGFELLIVSGDDVLQKKHHYIDNGAASQGCLSPTIFSLWCRIILKICMSLITSSFRYLLQNFCHKCLCFVQTDVVLCFLTFLITLCWFILNKWMHAIFNIKQLCIFKENRRFMRVVYGVSFIGRGSIHSSELK